MSHPEQLGFFSAVAKVNQELLRGSRVIEIGSFDVNGSIRKIFDAAADYTGVDLKAGPGVDLVSYGHEVDQPAGSFDFALSGECFEHDPHWRDTFQNMARMTRPGGLVAFTCASQGRPEHGTKRTDLEESPGTQAQGLDYYHNLTAADFERDLPLSEMFTSYRFWFMPTSFDLYFAGVRAGGPADPAHRTAQVPLSADIEALRHLMSWPHRVVRLPLRVLAKAVPEERFQNVALPYWRGLLWAQDHFSGGRFRRAEHG